MVHSDTKTQTDPLVQINKCHLKHFLFASHPCSSLFACHLIFVVSEVVQSLSLLCIAIKIVIINSLGRVSIGTLMTNSDIECRQKDE